MGIQMSTTNVSSKTLTENISNIIIKHASNCGGFVNQEQIISLGDIKGDLTIDNIDMDQSVTLNVSCLQNSDTTNSIKNEIKDKLNQVVESANNTGQINTSIMVDISEKINKISNNINIDTIKTCLVQSISEQKIIVDRISGNVVIKNIKMKQVSDIISKCIQNDTELFQNINDISKEIELNTKASNNGIFIIAGIIIFIIMVMIFVYFSNKKPNNNPY